MHPATTVCVPTWGGAAFIGETLRALQQQDWPAMEIRISVDGNDRDTAAACAPFLADPRVRLAVQPARLGWVGNTNALIAAADTEFVAIMPHDDLPAPDWLGSLHRVLRAHPRAVCAYADIEGFGTSTMRFAQPEVSGPPLQRVLETMLNQGACVAYRGLLRLGAAADRPLVPTGLPGDISADTAWLMVLAQRGELRREPRVLVRKRYHPRNTHGAWSTRPPEDQRAAFVALLARMRAIALAGTPGATAAAAVNLATLLRLAGCGEPLLPPELVALPDMVAAYAATTGAAGTDALPSWQELAHRPELELLAARLGAPSFRRALAAAELALAGTPHAALGTALRTLAQDVTRDRLRWRRRWQRGARAVAEAMRRRTGRD